MAKASPQPPQEFIVIGLTAPAPAGTVPSIPQGYLKTAGRYAGGKRLSRAQLATMGPLIEELVAYAPDLRATFGSLAPDPAVLADRVRVAFEWRRMRDRAAAWADFASHVDAAVWTSVLEMLDDLKPLFHAAQSRAPEAVAELKALAAVFEAQKLPAKTRAQNRRKKEATRTGRGPAKVTGK